MKYFKLSVVVLTPVVLTLLLAQMVCVRLCSVPLIKETPGLGTPFPGLPGGCWGLEPLGPPVGHLAPRLSLLFQP